MKMDVITIDAVAASRCAAREAFNLVGPVSRTLRKTGVRDTQEGLGRE